MIEELPLEFVMVVRNPRVSSDKFIFGENRILIAGYGELLEDFQSSFVFLKSKFRKINKSLLHIRADILILSHFYFNL